MMSLLLAGALVLSTFIRVSAVLDFLNLPNNVGSPPQYTDYCDMLSQEVQGKKHAFLAGNNAYYMSRGNWNTASDETIGLTHPFFNDLRSRGTGIVEHENTGTGNDFWGWEFHKYVKVARGTVIGGSHIGSPGDGSLVVRNTLEDGLDTEVCMTVPAEDNYGLDITLEKCDAQNKIRQQWTYDSATGLLQNKAREHCLFAGRPDLAGQKLKQWGCDASNQQMIWNFDETTGVLRARFGKPEFGNDGKCVAMMNPADGSGGAITDSCDTIIHKHTWDMPSADLEVRHEAPLPTEMHWRPNKMVMQYHIFDAVITEEKFISNTDVVATRMTSNIPIIVEFTGKTFAWIPSKTLSKNATLSFDAAHNAVHVIEGGKVQAKVEENPSVIKDAKLMYEGMSTIVQSDRPIQNYTQEQLDVGEHSYTFRLDVDALGTTLAWVMHDDFATALSAINSVVTDPTSYIDANTKVMNDLLNYNVPYFRSDDPDIVQVYYFLWAIHLLYYRHVGADQEVHRHTQSAVNNFLGLHNWDAVFQTSVGAWTADLPGFAYGNILLWSELPIRATYNGMVPDNMGRTWNSGLFGGNHHADHACSAWQIYQHSGDTAFLAQAYDFFHALFQSSGVLGESFDASICLGEIATELHRPQAEIDFWAEHMTRYGGLDKYVQNRWDTERSCWMHCEDTPDNTYSWGVFGAVGQSWFPEEYAVAMGKWLAKDNPDGFYSTVPLTNTPVRDWPKVIGSGWDNFSITPDTNFFMLKAMWQHDVTEIALDATLGHLKEYNMLGSIPCAPEARKYTFDLFGDQYSNFNAGKILNIVEGIGGFEYSVQDGGTFTQRPSLPLEWDHMEWRIPVRVDPSSADVDWVHVREDRYCTSDPQVWTKEIHVESNPLGLLALEPWTDGATVIETAATSVTAKGQLYTLAGTPMSSGRVRFAFSGEAAKGRVIVSMRLQANAATNVSTMKCSIKEASSSPSSSPSSKISSCIPAGSNCFIKQKKQDAMMKAVSNMFVEC
eukprot:CAMPEP_0194339854 /NCGR_PEP_ID=MMETSP0171-20130528/84537_1 /TAXON_ID=218684 /ORGANISM="Corethron pennatum, Strain L29A3" /LENGTH=1003 /DNA_ID=CAMNT_0039104585 /DNA_START=124 /DNA_END=3136 /DNA_ORIENTATION=+